MKTRSVIMKARSLSNFVLVGMMATALMATPASAQNIQQSVEEFEQLMPISGKVKTFFGDFELDHSFPTADTSERIYDLMDYSRAGDIVRIIVDKERKNISKKVYVARVKTPTKTGVEVKINGHRITSKWYNFIHRNDGYDYGFGKMLSI